MRGAGNASSLAGILEEIAEALLDERPAVLASDEAEIATRPGVERSLQHRQDRKVDFDGEAGLLGLDGSHAITDMLATKSNCVTTPKLGIEQNVEPYALPGADRPASLILGDVILGPGNE